MMFAIQIKYPANGTDDEFQLYPFRLVFQLLLDDRLGGKLYNNEVEYLVVFRKEMDEEKYERLVSQILALRKLSAEDMKTRFLEDQATYVKSVYE